MDLIQSYHDESHSSSSDDEPSTTNYAAPRAFTPKPSTSTTRLDSPIPLTTYSHDSTVQSNKVSSFEPIERIPLDRLMMATAIASTAKEPPKRRKMKKPSFQLSEWIADIQHELHQCIGSIHSLQKHTVLESIDHFISKLTKDNEKLNKPNVAAAVVPCIRTYLNIFKYLFRSMKKSELSFQGKRYYKRYIKLLALYTDLELCASIRGEEYDVNIAERLVLNYQTYLDNSNNSMALDVLLNTKRLFRQHRGILVLVFEYFLVPVTPNELPDTLYMKNFVMYKKWLYIEDDPEELQKARAAFITYIKPKNTLCMNSMFKPYLPVDRENFVTIANPNDILNKQIELKKLISYLKKTDIQLDVRPNTEVIVLTDEENERDSESNLTSNHDESNDYDWHSTNSQLGIPPSAAPHGPNVIETVTLDSPPPVPSTRSQHTGRFGLFDRSPSISSNSSIGDGFDLYLDAPDIMGVVPKRNIKSELQLEVAHEQLHPGEDDPQPSTISAEIPSTLEEMPEPSENTDNNDALKPLNESLFNRLVIDINSSHLSVPADVNVSVESNTDQSSCTPIDNNGQSMHSEEAIECAVPDEKERPVDNDDNRQFGKQPIDTVRSTTTNINNSDTDTNSHIDQSAADQPTPKVTRQQQKRKDIAEDTARHTPTDTGGEQRQIETDHIYTNTDTNITTSDSPLHNHEATLKNIEEIVADDLKGQEIMDTSDDVNVELDMDVNDGDGDGVGDAKLTDGGNDNLDGSVTASICTDTSLLSKSEQGLLFSDLFSTNNGQPPNEDQPAAPAVVSVKVSTSSSTSMSKSPIQSHQSTSPLAFRGNGVDTAADLKTYARRKQTPRLIEMRTMSTQTSRDSASPVTTIDDTANDSQKKDKHLMTEKVDDELFLRDIFHTSPDAPPSRRYGSPRLKSPIMYPASSTPMVPKKTTTGTATASFAGDESTLLQTTVETTANSTAAYATTTTATSSLFESTSDMPVKRKRGRPRKYPLPEPGAAPTPKPPRQPRQPRKTRSPKRDSSGEVIVFERMVLRQRKPKPPPPPPPPQPVRRRGRSKKREPKKRGRKPKNPQPEDETPKRKQPPKPRQTKAAAARAAWAMGQQLPPAPMTAQEKSRRGRRRRNTIKMTIDAIFNTHTANISAIQARRISHMLGIPFTAPQLTTILKRRNYNKSVNASNTSQIRLNGQMNHTESDAPANNTQTTNDTDNSTAAVAAASSSMPMPAPTTPSTILARKTYIKPNMSLSSLSNALRRMSRRISRRISRRFSYGTRRTSFSSSMPRHPVQVLPINGRKTRKQSPQKTQSQQQRYTKIDIFDTSTKGKRGRKKGSKNTKPSKPRTPSKRKQEMASNQMMSIDAWERQQQQLQMQQQQHQQIQVQQLQLPQPPVQQHHYHQHSNMQIFETIGDTVELVDLTEDIAPFELDVTNEMQMQFQNIEPALSSTQRAHQNDSFMTMSGDKYPELSRLDEIDTDATNEFTTDPESAVEDTDDSRTRKSKRSRKRPKILDL